MTYLSQYKRNKNPSQRLYSDEAKTKDGLPASINHRPDIIKYSPAKTASVLDQKDEIFSGDEYLEICADKDDDRANGTQEE